MSTVPNPPINTPLSDPNGRNDPIWIQWFVRLASAVTAAASVTWGKITGNIANQTDLQTALNAKVPLSRKISTSAPLTGGGDLSQDRTIGLDASQLDYTSTEVAAAFDSPRPVTSLDSAMAASAFDSPRALATASTPGIVRPDGTTLSVDNTGTLTGLSGIIGKAIFDGTGGVSSAVYSGVVSSVSYVSTGIYTVNLSGSPTNYSVAIIASSDTVFIRFAYINSTGSPSTQLGTTSFQFAVVGNNAGTWQVQDSHCITVTLFK